MRFFILLIFAIATFQTAAADEVRLSKLQSAKEQICSVSTKGLPEGDSLKWILSHLPVVLKITESIEETYVPDNAESVMSAAEAHLRAEVITCIDHYFKQTVQRLDVVRPKEISNPYEVTEFTRVLLWLRKVASNGISQYLDLTADSDIFSDEGVFLVEATGYVIDIYKLQTALNSDLDIKNVIKLKNYISSRFNALDYAETFDIFSGTFSKLSNDLKKIVIEILAKNILLNGSHFNKEGIIYSIAEKKDILKYYKEEMDKAGNEWMKEHLQKEQEKISALQKIDGSLSLTKVFNQLKEILSSSEGDSNLIDTVINKIKTESQSSITWKNTTFKEGDVFLSIDSGGWGDLFHSLAGLTNVFTHSGVLVSELNSGFKYYYFTDILEKINKTPINESSDDAVYIRPKFEVNDGFTTKAMNHLSDQEVFFDHLFSNGLYNTKGDYQLYCSEFIHFMYKNGFGSAANMPSPFDFIDTNINTENPKAVNNIKRMGLKPTQNFYVPDHLIFNTETVYIGQNLNTNYSSSNHPSKEKLQRDLSKQFNQKLGELFSTKNIRKIGFLEKLKIDAFILANSYMDWVSAPDIDFGDSEAKYIFVLYIQIYQALEEAFDHESDYRTALTDEERSASYEAYDSEVVPLINGLFED